MSLVEKRRRAARLEAVKAAGLTELDLKRWEKGSLLGDAKKVGRVLADKRLL